MCFLLCVGMWGYHDISNRDVHVAYTADLSVCPTCDPSLGSCVIDNFTWYHLKKYIFSAESVFELVTEQHPFMNHSAVQERVPQEVDVVFIDVLIVCRGRAFAESLD